MKCPRCQCELVNDRYQNKILSFFCPSCRGQAVTISGLRKLGVDEENTRNFWLAAAKGKLGSKLNCPECNGEMRIIKVDDGQCKFFIDLCQKCQLLWFDSGELEKIPLIPPESENLPQQAKEILAKNAIQSVHIHDDDTSGLFRSRWNIWTGDGDVPFDIPYWLLTAIQAAALIIKVIR